MRNNSRHIIICIRKALALMVITLSACRPGIPSDVLSEGDMVDILYDVHVAQAMTEVDGALKDNRDVVALRSAVLRKYGVTQKEYDRSYQFYCNHAEYMNEIYAELSDKIKENVIAAGGKVQGIETNEADSANVWNQETSVVLMNRLPYNKMTFDVIPDSTFRTGDRINLQYEAQMMVQEGSRDVVACLNVFYTNSTSASKVTHITTEGNGIITVANDSLNVKKITGFFMVAPQMSDSDKKQQFSLFILKNIKLLHLPLPKSQNGEQQEQNTDQK